MAKSVSSRQRFRGVNLDDDGNVDEAIPCAHCEYNVYKQDPRGRCPECGMAIEETLRRKDEGYLANEVRGVAVLTLLTNGGVAFLLALARAIPDQQGEPNLVLNLIAVAFWFGSFATVFYAWRIFDRHRSRQALRWLVLAGVLCAVLRFTFPGAAGNRAFWPSLRLHRW